MIYLIIYLEELIVDNMYDINENTFTNLKQLKILSIFSYNDLKDEWLKNLNNLTELSIPKKATFSGNCLQYFKNLRFLHIRNCSNMDDELLLNCKQLTNINVSFCNKIFGNCFKELNELKHLNINYCYNVKEDFLNNLNNLESLNIIECKNIFGHCLQNLQQLQTLNIKVHSVTQLNILIHLKNLKNLHIVFIKDKNTETTIFLLNLINLEKLYLKSFKDFIFRDEDFYNLKNLKFLKIVTKKNNLSKFTGKYTQYCTKLEKISCNVSFEVKYLDYLTNIKFLNLQNIKENIYFNKAFSQFKKLEKLKLSSKFEIIINNDPTDLQLFTNLKHLTLQKLINLNVSELDIEDKDLMELNNIQYLNVTYCPKLVSGTFLLNMNKLIHLVCLEDEDLNKIEIDKVKNEIKKGNTLVQAVNYVLNKNY
ncbi:hypothetical protein ABK040_004321 [Willaertia magna]